MDKFTPFEKLSKKKQKELNSLRRNTWENLNPVTKTKNSAKIYKRKKHRMEDTPDDAFYLALI